MRSRMIARIALTGTLLCVTAVVATACVGAASPAVEGAPPQSLEQACLLMSESMTSEQITAADSITPSAAAGDPDTAIAAFRAVQDQVNVGLTQVTEPSVKQRALGALSHVDAFIEALENVKGASSGVDLTALDDKYAAMRAGYADLNDSCRVVNGFGGEVAS